MKKILKNKKLITAVAMILMVTLVIGMGTMTYSRYVTSKGMDTPEQATVAKWGYVLSINQEDMFGAEYEGGVVNEAFIETADDKIDVTSKSSAQLVAPGTEGSMTITLSGSAEVLAKLTVDVTDDSHDVKLVYDTDKTYSPIKWTLTKKVGDASATTLGTANTTFANIVDYLEDEGAIVEAGTDVPETVYTISWAWDLGNEDINDETNKLDTALGMLAEGKSVQQIKDQTGITVDDASSVKDLSVKLSAAVMQIGN